MFWAACGAPTEPGDGPGAEIGTGTLVFDPLEDGQPLDLIAGIQGGFHFVLHARMAGLEPGDAQQSSHPDNPVTRFRVLDQAGARVDIEEVRTVGYEDVGDGWHALASGRIVRIANDRVPALYGTEVRIQLRIDDVHGRVAQDEVRVIAVEYGLPVSGARR